MSEQAWSEVKRWGGALALLVLPPLAGYGMTAFPHAKTSARASLDPASAPAAAPAPAADPAPIAAAPAAEPPPESPAPTAPPKPGGPPRCSFLVPSYFTVEPGRAQHIRAFFEEEGSGVYDFTWTTTGGALRAVGNGATLHPTLPGRIVVDSFLGSANPELWEIKGAPDAKVTGTIGGLDVRIPGGGTGERLVRLQSRVPVWGDFVAELTVSSLSVDAIYGAVTLEVLTQDGFNPHIQRGAANDFIGVESNQRWKDGPWLGSYDVYEAAGPRRLRMKREDRQFRFSYVEIDNGREVELGSGPSTGSAALGLFEITTWANMNLPRVAATFKNFSFRTNDAVIWQSDPSATSDDLFTIRLGDKCSATGKIAQPIR